MNTPLRALALALIATLLGACTAGSPAQLTANVVASYPHDPQAFTQGLLLANGKLYESTGLYGASTLREVEPSTGEVIRLRSIDPRLFGEGLALVGDELIQLTWRAGTAIVYDLETFEPLRTYSYAGEGWGLCYDGEDLWMSDGSATLTVRDPRSFQAKRRVAVTSEGKPVTRLNELECVGAHIYANVWQSNSIVRINKKNGQVDAEVDTTSLLPQEQRAQLSPDAVLNGVAYDPVDELFLVTGKLWPTLFAVRFE